MVPTLNKTVLSAENLGERAGLTLGVLTTIKKYTQLDKHNKLFNVTCYMNLKLWVSNK